MKLDDQRRMFGTLTLNGDFSFEYTPDLDFCGIDAFSYQVCDDMSVCDTASVVFTDQTQVLLNDGVGTPAPLLLSDATVVLEKSLGKEIVNEWSAVVADDVLPPEEFSVVLERTPNAFSNRAFIVFNTTDKQSGIDHYEVMEEPLDDGFLFRSDSEHPCQEQWS